MPKSKKEDRIKRMVAAVEAARNKKKTTRGKVDSVEAPMPKEAKTKPSTAVPPAKKVEASTEATRLETPSAKRVEGPGEYKAMKAYHSMFGGPVREHKRAKGQKHSDSGKTKKRYKEMREGATIKGELAAKGKKNKKVID